MSYCITFSSTRYGSQSRRHLAVLCDRDGVLNELYSTAQGLDSPARAVEVRVMEGAPEFVARMNRAGRLAMVVSNQPGVAKGKHSLADLHEVTSEMHRQLGAEGGDIPAWYYCLHHPDAVVDEYRTTCDCRKPHPGLLSRALGEHGLAPSNAIMIGDNGSDIIAGKAIGCCTVLLRGPGTRPQAHWPVPDFICERLTEAADWIEARCPGS